MADSALLLDAIHGATDADADHAPPFSGSYRDAAARPPARLRVAVSRKIPPGLIGKVSGAQRGAWERMGALLGELGHEVVERDPAYGLAQLDFVQMWVRGVYEESLEVPDPDQLERSTRQMAAAGRRLVPPRRRDALLRKRTAVTARITELWNEVDVLLTPGLASTPIVAEGAYGRPAPLAIDRAGRFTPFTPLFNLTGQPAVTIPAGIADDGLPLSVQLVGRHGAEDMLYSLAGADRGGAPMGRSPPRGVVSGKNVPLAAANLPRPRKLPSSGKKLGLGEPAAAKGTFFPV